MFKTNTKYHFNPKSDNLDVILHGGSQGIDSSFILKLFEASEKEGNSVVAFNFPYLERGDDHSSGAEVVEEREIVASILESCDYRKYKTIRILGKSLGAIIAAKYFESLAKSEVGPFSITVLGYDVGQIGLKKFPGNILIVQGSKDKYGDIEVVKNDLRGAISKNIKYLSVEDADHSFRVPETKEPVYEDKAVSLAFSK